MIDAKFDKIIALLEKEKIFDSKIPGRNEMK